MKVKDIMSIEFVKLGIDDKLEDVLQKFAKKGITSSPVVDGDEFLGIFSAYDLLPYVIKNQKAALLPFGHATKSTIEHDLKELSKIPLQKLVRKPPVVLTPDQEVSSVIEIIATTHTCIPVLESGSLVGIVRERDLVFYLLYLMGAVKTVYRDESEKERDNKTTVDLILQKISQRGSISAKELSKELGVSEKTVERIGETLQKHNLAHIEYSFLKGAILKRLERE